MPQTAAQAFTWRDAPDLTERLTAAQNHPRFTHQDILTFAGFMKSREALEAYVAGKEALAAAYVAPKRVRSRAVAA